MMTPQERDVITGIFDRLKQAANAPRDPEAERYIAELIASQPYAPYVMAQSVYVQEQALTNLQNQVQQLQQQVEQLQSQPAAAPQSGGFLSGLFGGGAAPAPRPGPQAGGMAMQGRPAPGYDAPPAAQPGPWGQAQAAAQPSAVGGFMRSAATTAAGVAGGLVLGNVLMNAFSGGGHAQAATALGAPFGGDQATGSDQAYRDGYQDAQQDDQLAADDDRDQDAAQDASYDDGDTGGDDDSWA